jgi:hypothetical protein
MVAGESMARGAKGHYAASPVDVLGEGRRARGDRLSETVKLTVLAGQWMAEAHRGRYYAKARTWPAAPPRPMTRSWPATTCWSCRPCR